MIRLFVALLALAASADAFAQRVEIPSSLVADFPHAVPVQPGNLVVADISKSDWGAGPQWNADSMLFTGRKGDVVALQLSSKVPTLFVRIQYHDGRTGRALFESQAKTPMRFTLPKDGSYLLIVHASGPQREGKYLLAFGADGALPALVDTLIEPELPSIPGIFGLHAGESLVRPGGPARPAVDSFQFIAGAGSKVRLQVRGSGPLVLTWYSPQGVRMQDGTADDKFDATMSMPVDGLYFATVSRRDGDKPYQVELQVEEPR